MAFLIYSKTVTGDKIRYERIKSIRLAGPEGLIARHVRSLPTEQCVAWKLDADALHRLAGAAGENIALLFDATTTDANTVCLYELTCLHGSCEDTSTNLALDFNIVVDRDLAGFLPGSTALFEAPPTETPKLLREILALTGGPRGGDWRWGASSMQLGATVVAAHSF